MKLAAFPPEEIGRRAAVIEAANRSLAPGPGIIELPFSFGDRVQIDGDIQARAVGFCFYPHGMQIQCSWFHNGDAKTDWFASWRVTGI